MIHRSVSQLSLDSVVFENRNQSYGAYDLRSVYNLHLMRSLAIALFFCGSFFGSVYIAGQFLPVADAIISAPDIPITIIDVVLEPQKPEIKSPAPAAADKPPVTTTNTNSENPNYVPTSEIDPADIPVEPSTTNDGTITETNGIPGGMEGGEPGGTGTDPNGVTGDMGSGDEDGEGVINNAEENPEFEGGQSAMYEYLRSHLRYPAMARDTEGKVYVSFIINKHGEVDKVEIVRSVHPLLDEEAERVIKSMPAWKPGKQHGRPVNVRMVIPIAFKIN